MSTRTTMTASVAIPATIRWKCSKCGSINTTASSVGVVRQTTTTRLFTGDAEQENKKALEAEWKDKILGIMTEPRSYAREFRAGVYKKNCKCAHCNNKEFWARDQWYLRFLGLVFPAILFTGISAFAVMDSIGLWLAFAASVGALIYSIVEEESYKTNLGELSPELTPTFITDNQEMIDYAEEKGYNIAAFEADQPAPTVFERAIPADEYSKSTVEPAAEQAVFCRRCGKKLKPGSVFCSYCGTSIR